VDSCIYRGIVSHHRRSPNKHHFSYSLYMLFLNLDELNEVFHGRFFWSHRFPTFHWFRRKDHMGPANEPLDVSVRRFVEREVGQYPIGPIRLLTNLRQYGFQMNPVSFYYLYDTDETNNLQAIVVEIHNTPWNEEYCYLVTPEMWNSDNEDRMRTDKQFHVSPFMPMEQSYRWEICAPSNTLSIKMNVEGATGKYFQVSLNMKRIQISTLSLAWMTIRFPWMTARIYIGIYFQAFRLWMKKTPFFIHPDKKKMLSG
jgi:uncharacterized protein